MKFMLSIETDNDTVVDDPAGELSRMLTDVVRWIREDDTAGAVLDTNGNTVGEWTLDL